MSHLLTRLSAGLIARRDPECMLELQSTAPVIYGVLKCLPEKPISNAWQSLFNALKSKAEYVK